MFIKGLIDEDFVNYKKISMTIMFPFCTFKCGTGYCQNSPLAHEKNIEIDIKEIVSKYMNNPITESIVMQGLEPFESWNDLLEIVKQLREKCNNNIIIYTGFNKDEILEQVKVLSKYSNIIIKFGRYIPNQEKHYDEILHVYLASDNQYAEKIS